MTEGDELAMQAQWIDLIAFDLLMGRLDAAKEQCAKYCSDKEAMLAAESAADHPTNEEK